MNHPTTLPAGIDAHAALLALLGLMCCHLVLAAADGSPSPGPARPNADFSNSNSVSIFFGQEDQALGLNLVDWKADGQSSKVHVVDVPCRCLKPNPPDRPEAYFYFTIDPSFKTRGVQNVRIDVEYFDVILEERPLIFWIHYDASGFTGSNPRYADATPRVRLQNSNIWQTATFHIRRGTFANAQNGKADFRIVARPPDLYVRRVTVTREDVALRSVTPVQP